MKAKANTNTKVNTNTKANTTVTFIVDNQARADLKSEHGLAMLIEHNGLRILFDNGSGEALFVNARRLHQGLDDLDVLIISHGHYDHTHNTAWLLQQNPQAKIYLHPDALQTRYSKHPDKPLKLISMKAANQQAILQHPPEQVIMQTKPMQITEGLVLSGQIPRHSAEDTGGPFYLDETCKIEDQLLDDQCLWLFNDNQMHIITGCCHSGVINTINWSIKQNRQSVLVSLTGGLHLSNASLQRIERAIDVLTHSSLKVLRPAHCSGEAVSTHLKEVLSPSIEVLPTQAGFSFCLKSH